MAHQAKRRLAHIENRKDSLNADALILHIPADIARDTDLSLAAKGLYLTLFLHGSQSLSELSRSLNLSRPYIRKLAGELEQNSWASMASRPNLSIAIPVAPKATQTRVGEWLNLVRSVHPRQGETIVGLWCYVLVPTACWVRNSRPWFLQNPDTGEFLEYDFFSPEYKQSVEFHGRQHFETTEDFPSQSELAATQARDRLKAELSEKHGINLTVITTGDLSYEGVWAKLANSLPKREWNRNDPVIQGLEKMSAEYRAYETRRSRREKRTARPER